MTRWGGKGSFQPAGCAWAASGSNAVAANNDRDLRMVCESPRVRTDDYTK